MNVPTEPEMREMVCGVPSPEYVDPEMFDAWLERVKRDAWWAGQQSCSDTYPWEDNPYA